MASCSFKYVLLAAPFLLTACGEGWEMVRTEQFPYGNQRTAGTGVAYVRAKMLPEKELKIESPATAPVVAPPPPMSEPLPKQPDMTPDTGKGMEKVFQKEQSK